MITTVNQASKRNDFDVDLPRLQTGISSFSHWLNKKRMNTTQYKSPPKILNVGHRILSYVRCLMKYHKEYLSGQGDEEKIGVRGTRMGSDSNSKLSNRGKDKFRVF